LGGAGPTSPIGPWGPAGPVVPAGPMLPWGPITTFENRPLFAVLGISRAALRLISGLIGFSEYRFKLRFVGCLVNSLVIASASSELM